MLNNEPKQQQNEQQIIDVGYETDEGQRINARVWRETESFNKDQRFLRTVENIIAPASGLLGLVTDGVLWVSAFAVAGKVISNLQGLLTFVSPSVITVLIIAVFLGLAFTYWLTYDGAPSLRRLLSFRLALVIIGLILGVA